VSGLIPPSLEIAIDEVLGVDLFILADEILELHEDEMELVARLLRAAWCRGYYHGLRDPRGGFLVEHGYKRPKVAP
jgi:hypothetical protein